MLKKIIVTTLVLGACITVVSIISAFGHTGADKPPETVVEAETPYAQTTLKGRVNADGTIADPGTGGWVANKIGASLYQITVTDVGFTPASIIGVASPLAPRLFVNVSNISNNSIYVDIKDRLGNDYPSSGFSFFLYVKG